MRDEPRRAGGCIYSRPNSKNLWLKYYSNGVATYCSAKTSDHDTAEKLLKKRLARVELKIHPELRESSFEDLMARFVEDYQLKGRRSRPGDKVARLTKFFAGFRASEITKDSLRLFILNQKKQNYSNATINRSLAALRHGFRLAEIAAPTFSMLPEANARQGFLTHRDFQRVMAHLPPHVKPVVAAGFTTGMRLGELLNLRWSNLDLLNGVIRLDPGETKNGTGRVVPIATPELRALLVRQREVWRKRERRLLSCFSASPKPGTQ